MSSTLTTKTFKARHRIRICRMTMHFSQTELAYLLEVPMQSISRWETGRGAPNLYYAIGLSVATRRLVDELFSDYRNQWINKIKQRMNSLRLLQKQKAKRIEARLKVKKIQR
jgi:DNA-binding XRE family transcriptional regulator